MKYALTILALLAYGLTASAAIPSKDGTAVIASGTPPSIAASFGPLTDASGNVWTVVSGVISENGKSMVGTHGVFELLLCKGVIWQAANTKNEWWSWSGTAWSPMVTVDPTPTCPPVGPVTPPVTASYSATITWTAATTDTNGNPTAITGFNIYEGTTPATLAKVASVGPTVTTYTIKNLPSGAQAFAVTALNPQGEGQLVSPLPAVPQSVL